MLIFVLNNNEKSFKKQIPWLTIIPCSHELENYFHQHFRKLIAFPKPLGALVFVLNLAFLIPPENTTYYSMVCKFTSSASFRKTILVCFRFNSKCWKSNNATEKLRRTKGYVNIFVNMLCTHLFHSTCSTRIRPAALILLVLTYRYLNTWNNLECNDNK